MRIIKSNEVLTDNFGGVKAQGNKSFKETLKTALDSVNKYQLEYDSLQNQNIFGDEVDLHNIVIAGEKARISLELTLQIRNKAMEAYQEIMRMQI